MGNDLKALSAVWQSWTKQGYSPTLSGLYTSINAAKVPLAFEVPSSLVSVNLADCSQLKP